MATTKADLFHDDLCAILRKHGLEPQPTKLENQGFALAFDGLMEAVEELFDARGPALSCDHCGALVTRLCAVREPKGSLIAVCSQCRDGIERDLAERDDPANGPESEGSFNAWANRGMARR